MSETQSTDFSKILEDAEKQVSGVKDDKLREIAFSKLVSHLLDHVEPSTDEDEEQLNKSMSRKTKRTSTKTSKVKQEGPSSWLRELATEEFFKEPKSSVDIREELETRSHHLSATDLTSPLEKLCHDKVLRRKKISPEGGGKTFLHWVNW